MRRRCSGNWNGARSWNGWNRVSARANAAPVAAFASRTDQRGHGTRAASAEPVTEAARGRQCPDGPAGRAHFSALSLPVLLPIPDPPPPEQPPPRVVWRLGRVRLAPPRHLRQVRHDGRRGFVRVGEIAGPRSALATFAAGARRKAAFSARWRGVKRRVVMRPCFQAKSNFAGRANALRAEAYGRAAKRFPGHMDSPFVQRYAARQDRRGPSDRDIDQELLPCTHPPSSAFSAPPRPSAR